LGTAGAIWAASGAMGTVVKAVNRAYERRETRPFWKLRIVSIVLVVAGGVVTIGTLLLIVGGGTVGGGVADRAGAGGAWRRVWDLLRWPLAFCIVLLLFALVYYLAPNESQRSWKWLTPGSLLGAVLWIALSGLFAIYTAFSTSYSKTYGALAG